MATEFGDIGTQARFDEQTRDFCAESRGWFVIPAYRAAQDVTDFFFHAPAITVGPPLQAGLYGVFDIADHELGHRKLLIMIS